MHQDQRIGLALGVLLVGACAALFFRNETRVLPNAPQLKNARELDERIAERPTRPYMKGIETVEVADQRRVRSADPGQAASGSKTDQQLASVWNPFTLLTRKAPNEKAVRDRMRTEKTVAVDNDVQEFSPLTAPIEAQFVSRSAVQNEVAAGSDDSNSDAGSQELSTSHTNDPTYVVQKGECLSSIAAKLLGDRSRYQELFEANQDQLDDPNDVKLGMTLRIPNRRIRQEPQSYAQRSRPMAQKKVPVPEPVETESDRPINLLPPVVDINSNESQTTAPDELPKLIPPQRPIDTRIESPAHRAKKTEDPAVPKKFVPAKRSPLPRQTGPQAKATDQPNVAGRKLSQISMETTPSKVAR
jgi:hypothetical protein